MDSYKHYLVLNARYNEFNPLKPKLNKILFKNLVPTTKKMHFKLLHYKDQLVNPVYYENHTKPTNTFCGEI
jgi:hypothetical protein